MTNLRFVAHASIMLVLAGGALIAAGGRARTLDAGAWLANGDFDTSISAWTFPGYVQSASFRWDSADHAAAPDSGSGVLRIDDVDTSANVWAGQCRPVPDRASQATLDADVQYPADLGDSNTWLLGAFFADVGCSGEYLGAMGNSVHEAQGGWVHLADVRAVPPGARSIEVRLGLLKVTGMPVLEAWYDGVGLAFDAGAAYSVIAPGLARD